jgi:deoxyribose-phosphate aldolase
MNTDTLPQYIDHTLLKPDATRADIERLCAEAREHHFKSVCVNGCHTAFAADLLKDSGVLVATVTGFPLGAGHTAAKCRETAQAVADGSAEVDVVINIGRLKDGATDDVLDDLRQIAEAAQDHCLKVILETCLLSREEIVTACKLVVESGAAFVKTSTGFSTGGATVETVRLMRETVGPAFGVKASGGIRDTATALAMIGAGATRLGTSSGAAIVRGLAGEDGAY